ncbi:MAG: methionyl-tRNA formyltransferase [Solirubrobacteraceae bacterium]
MVFLGTSEFAAAILERLADSEHRPTLVLTRPDRPSGRGRRLTPPPVAERARSLGIALEQPESVNDSEAAAMIARAGSTGSSTGRQTVVVCAFGALIKEPLLSEHDLFNVHPSLLPRWRGAAPIERALMAGDRETGVSIMKLTAGLDSGPVCLVGEEQIRARDTYGSLASRLQQLGGELLVRALTERPPFVEQPEEGVTYAEKITAADRLLDPEREAIELERVVRALQPHIGARAALQDGTLLGVHSAALAEDLEGSSDPAQLGVRAHEGRLLLVCRAGSLELLVVQPPGSRAMDASAYLRGHGALGRA